MPKIDIPSAPDGSGSRYPDVYRGPVAGRMWKRLGDAAGLSQFGVNLLTLKSGVWSSQRHWHAEEDEFAFVLSGEVVLVEDDVEHVLRAGDCAGWKAGVRNGHCLQNRAEGDAVVLVVGSRQASDRGEYPDIDMIFSRAGGVGGAEFKRKDGTPF